MERALLILLFAVGCGGGASSTPPPNNPPPPPAPTVETRGDGSEAPPPTTGPTTAPGKMVEVNSKETPIPRCGPGDSYHYVASEFKCADGTNPLGGNPKAGAAARIGNVGPNSTGHIIDLYEVPCPEGPKRVYVDMYGCPGGPGGGGKI
jgi:hypothetical protein